MDNEFTRKISDLNQLTVRLYKEGNYMQALVTAQQSTLLSRDTFGEDHPDYASSLNSLAVLYEEIGSYQKAEPLYIKVLEIRKNILGKDDPNYTTSLNNLAELYEKEGSYQKAEPLYIEILEIRKNILGIDHPDYATSLNDLAGLYREIGTYQKAEPLYIQALEIREKTLGIGHSDYANSLNGLALLYKMMGAYQKAQPLYIQALEMREKALGKEHLGYATSLNNLAGLYVDMGLYQKAEPLYIQTLEIWKKTRGIDNPSYATLLNNLAMLYNDMGAFQKAEPLYIQSLEIREKALGKDHPDYANSLNSLAELYRSMGSYDKAEPLYIQSGDIWKKTLGKEHPNYATSLNNLAGLYGCIGLYQKAEPLYIQALEIRKNILGIDHPDYATGLDNLALLYQLMEDYQKAEPLHILALEIREKVLSADHPKYATSLNNLARLYNAMGLYQKAELFYIQALEIWKKVHGKGHPDYAIILNNLAGFYYDMGAYKKAEQLYIEALKIREKALGVSHPDYASTLNGLGQLYKLMGAYKKAELLYIQVLEIQEKTIGKDHPDYASSLSNLAELYQLMGAYQKAEPLYIQALEIREKALGVNHSDYANSISNLAWLYEQDGAYRKAELLYIQVLEIRGKTIGNDHPAYANSLNNLAEFYRSMGSYDKAGSLYMQAGEIWKKTLGKDHANYVKYLQNYAMLYAATDKLNEAVTMMTEAALIEDRVIGEVFSISSEKQRMEYLLSERYSAETFVSLLTEQCESHPDAIKDALSFVLKRKSITAEALTAQRDAIIDGKYPHLRDKLHQLNALRMQIARKLHADPGQEGSEAHQRILAEWNNEKEHLEAELLRQIPDLRLEQNLRNANSTVIANNLPSESILLEFFRYTEIDFKAISAKGERRLKPPRYCAFILPAGSSEGVRLIDLGEAYEIDQLIIDYKSKLSFGRGISSEKEYPDPPANTHLEILSRLSSKKKFADEERSRISDVTVEMISDKTQSDMGLKAGLDLYSSLIAPIKAVIGNCHHLVIAPDSQLSLIPFEVIPTPEGGYLADQYRISYVGVGRDILRFKAQIPGKAEKALVMASPDFDLQIGKKKKTAKSITNNGRRSRDFSRSSEPYLPLKGAKLEGEQIGKLLGIKPLLEKEALEGRLKSVSSPHILHIATHGFFLKDQEMPSNKEGFSFGMQGEMGIQRLSGAGIENPMLRSGLLLAGVNTWMKNGELPPEAEDGILTAEDVTALDLTNTNLVVLSACETGLGDVMVGEGVFGLRRAFAIAGAKTLIMSLWKVPDICTQELMEDFYRRILTGTPKAEALREAQLKLREKYPHPRDWGGFICQGDPGPIPMYKSPQ